MPWLELKAGFSFLMIKLKIVQPSMMRCATKTARAMGLREAEINGVLEEATSLWTATNYDQDGLLNRDEWSSAAYVLA